MNDLNPSLKLVMRPRAGGCPAMFLLAGLLAVVTPLRADNPLVYLFQWGSYGGGNGQFNDPFGIAVDRSNNVYVVDGSNSRIEKFEGNGNYLTQWGSYGSGNGQFEHPNGVAVDSSDNVYVTDGSGRVEKFDGNGNYLTQWGSQGSGNGQFGDPFGIAVDSSNNVYVTDYENDRVEKFNSNGNYLTQWGTSGSGNGQFYFPEGFVVDSSNNVYVVDSNNERVQKFDSNGNYLTQWGSNGSGNGQFNGPFGVAVDRSNNVYVTDTENYRIEKFDHNGNYLTQWGGYGSGNGQFSGPRGIAVDSTGNFIYVTDLGNDRIQVFANSTAQLKPYITSQSAVSQNVVAGTNVSFSVTAVGGEPLAYQWTSNTIALFNVTNSTFTLANVTPSDSATYAVTVANNFGYATSSNIVLTVVPALVTTLPATGISAAGAVLNGSVTVGEDTVVWFNWGTNTSYGNVTATTIAPGGSGTTNLSATLNGLSTNVYHYQIVATNISGIAYGNDQSFVVTDGAPTVTTLSSVGTTLYGMVNPNGLDTTVYFEWGSTLLTNSTPGMDIGAGATPLNVSRFITGLTPLTQYHYEVVASNYLGTVYGTSVAFYSAPFVSVPGEDWTSVAASADGSVMIAVANPGNTGPGGPIYISTNSGAVWNQATNAPPGRWESVACSADGSKIIAAEGGAGGSILGPIYTSTDTGTTWVSNNAPVTGWQSVASSADGSNLVAADLSAHTIYISTNAGATWMPATHAPRLGWYSVASSADGSKLAAVPGFAYFPSPGATNIYTSTNFGATWITNKVPATPVGIQNNWTAIASSADGSKLIAAGGGYESLGNIFLSTNFGASWALTATNILPSHGRSEWFYVASSADGSQLAAVSDAGLPVGVITSTDSGATWITNSVPNLTWNAVALSADGDRMVVAAGYPSNVGPIYTTQTMSSPVLNLSVSDNVLSWITPSLDFTLQQSPDLSNWADVTNLPVLNLTNLQNQVALPAPVGNRFFRLVH